MENAIPQGYRTVGEIAKQMGTTVRTLQYYDKLGLLSPSAVSQGGRRLYTDQDVVKLHQILSLKHLGFSLEDIKDRLIPLDTPEKVAEALDEQARSIRAQVARLSDSLQALEALRTEVLQMQSVDFQKYADIIVNLQMHNKYYWLIKHFDDRTLEHIRRRFDRKSGLAFLDAFTALQQKAIDLYTAGTAPESQEAQDFAKSYWDMINQFTGGDQSLLPKLMALGQQDNLDAAWKEKQEQANAMIGPALEVYFARLGQNPFEGATE